MNSAIHFEQLLFCLVVNTIEPILFSHDHTLPEDKEFLHLIG